MTNYKILIFTNNTDATNALAAEKAFPNRTAVLEQTNGVAIEANLAGVPAPVIAQNFATHYIVRSWNP